jgi:uracil-DNA glycosylase family protein
MADADRPGAEEWVPRNEDIAAMRDAVQACRGCELWRDATQAVFGEGDPAAPMMLVGEQPGDREDLAGEPFVGPAGRILDAAVERAGIERDSLYVTNAVKHFRFEERGKRRIHKKPAVGHIDACRPWLEAEVRAVDPAVIVCLGATAARAVLGRSVGIAEARGQAFTAWGRKVVVTTHPAAIVRLRDADERAAAIAELADDLAFAAGAATRSA